MDILAIFMIAIIVPTTLCQFTAFRGRGKQVPQTGLPTLLSKWKSNGIARMSGTQSNGGVTGISRPWQVSMLLTGPNGHVCNGTLVLTKQSKIVVVTSAHCVIGASPGPVMMRFGSAEKPESKTVSVTKIIRHPKFDMDTLSNDIAVMILAENALADTDGIFQVHIANSDLSEYYGQPCYETGLGQLSIGGSSSNLPSVAVNLLTQDKCSALIGRGFDEETMLCRRDVRSGGMESCRDDSGKQLVCRSDRGWDLVGVVRCADGEHSGARVYTKAFIYKEWIENME